MEKVNQFLDYLRERFSSPFFYSFIISWIFCNWEVSVAMLWFDPPANAHGQISLIEYISKMTNNTRSIYYPIGLALVYTFGSPILNNIISAFRAWNSKWGESWNLSILKGGKVSIEKYMEFKRQYQERTKILEEVISSESATVSQLETVNTALQETRNQLNRSAKELSDIRAVVDNYNNTSYIEGKWIRTTINAYNNTEKMNIEFRNGIVYEYDGVRQLEKFRVHSFSFDLRTKRLTFTLFHFGSDTKKAGSFFSFNDLEYRHNEFAGNEYQSGESIEIRYERSLEIPKQEINESIERIKVKDTGDASVIKGKDDE